MSRRRIVVIAAAIVLCTTRGHTEELGPSMPSTPAGIEAAPPSAPIVVRQEDAAAILRNALPRPEAPAPVNDGTRVFTADEPPRPVVNPTPRFVFDDQTDRPPLAVKSLPERKAAVEAVRQSVRGPGGR